MSEEQEPVVALGKHSREDSVEVEDGPQMPSADVDDSSDEEIGPMPVSASENGAEAKDVRKKKKRAGKLLQSLCPRNVRNTATGRFGGNGS